MWHTLALALGGRTVSEWKSVMTRREFLAWCAYYELFPYDDFHRYHRPAAMIAASFGGSTVAERLEWLQPEPVRADYNEADMNTLKAFGFKPQVKG